MQEEKWLPVVGYEGYYEVSSFGNVKRLKRYLTEKTGKVRVIQEKICKKHIDDVGYLFVNLMNDGSFRVHKLVAMAFLNHSPAGHNLVIDHIDDDKLNNNVSNLRIISHRENISKGFRKKKKYSQHTGVYWHKTHSKWYSSIYIDGRLLNSKNFNTEQEALNWRIKMENEYGTL